MSGTTIKLNSVRLLLLRAAMKKEELRLQSAAAQVARIASSLEMEVAAKKNIDDSLTKLRKQLKQGAENMSTMQKMADLAMSELSKKDSELAEQAKNLDGTMQRFQSLAGAASAAGGTVPNAHILTVLEPSPLDLASQLAADATQRLGSLFGLADDKLTDRLQNIDLTGLFDDKRKTAAGVAGAGAVAAGTTALVLTDAWDSAWRTSGSKKSSSSSSKKSKKKEGWLSKAGNALGNAGKSTAKWFGDKANDVKDWAGDKISDAKDWAEDRIDDAKDAITAGGKWAVEKGADLWDGLQEIASSKPAQYVWEIGGDVLSGAGDVVSFAYNVGTFQWGDAAADFYNVVANDFFDLAQDVSALGIYGLGAGAEALGVKSDTAQYFYDAAEDYANRNGLAGELYANNLDSLGKTVDTLDTIAGVYKTATGFGKLNDAWGKMEWDNLGDLGKNLLSISGWKGVDSLTDAAQLNDKIARYKNISSNYKLAYKYVDSFTSGENWLNDGGLIYTAAENTSVGKVLTGSMDTIENVFNLFQSDPEPVEQAPNN